MNLIPNLDHEKPSKSEPSAPVAKEVGKDNVDDGSVLVPSSRLRLPIVIVFQDWFALEKACDSIAFVVRDPAHIAPNNIEVIFPNMAFDLKPSSSTFFG